MLYRTVFVAVMAAMVFVTTYFLKIPIMTPAGPTMIKVANIVCLLSGLLFGGVVGGLAAGLGSMLFDLLDPMFVSSAPFTLVFFFIMGFLCGTISHMRGHKGDSFKLNLLGAAVGAVSYYVLNIGKSIILLMLAGSAFWPAFVANSTKMITSGINAAIAVAGAVALAIPINRAMKNSGFLDKF